jgi:hypothetical protein
MTAAATLDRARRSGVRVEPNGPKLRVVAPDDLPEPEWREIHAALAAHKVDVLRLLRMPAITGIVVDVPNPTRRRVALEAIQGEPGDVTGFVHPRHLRRFCNMEIRQ